MWQTSLRAMGTCGYMGTVPFSTVTRIAFVDETVAAPLAWAVRDASISIQNYLYCSEKYRAITAFVMGDALPATNDTTDLFGTRAFLASLTRDGITVEEVAHAAR